MIRISKIVILASIAMFAAFGVAHAASTPKKKKTYTVTMKVTQPCIPKGTAICATYSGTPFGTCKMTGQLVIPKSIQTWKCKSGSFVVDATGTSGAADDATGTWTVRTKKGAAKSKYTGITGKGTFSGKLSTGIFTYKGSVKY